MNKFVLAIGGIVWFGIVFAISLLVTFPSDPLKDRIAYEVQNATGGSTLLRMDSVGPWWIGLSADNVQVYSKDATTSRLLVTADQAWATTGLFSALSGAPAIAGGVILGDGRLDYAVETSSTDNGLEMSSLNLEGTGFPLADLVGLGGADMDGSGTLDIDVDLQAPEGMRKANGSISVKGKEMVMNRLSVPGTMLENFDIQVLFEDVDLALDVVEGRAKVSRGTIVANLANVDIDGSMNLKDDLGKTRLDLSFEIELGDELDQYKVFLKDALWADGKYHYRLTGSFNRPLFRADRENRRPGPRTGGSATRRPTVSSPSRVGGSSMTDEERKKRAEEIRERIRKRREEREASRSGGVARRPTRNDDAEELEPAPGEDDEYIDDEELPPEDEEFIEEEELPPEDEEYIE